jgi:hypothetical protein
MTIEESISRRDICSRYLGIVISAKARTVLRELEKRTTRRQRCLAANANSLWGSIGSNHYYYKSAGKFSPLSIIRRELVESRRG